MLSLPDKIKLVIGIVILILLIFMFKKEIKDFFLKILKQSEVDENVGENNSK